MDVWDCEGVGWTLPVVAAPVVWPEAGYVLVLRADLTGVLLVLFPELTYVGAGSSE